MNKAWAMMMILSKSSIPCYKYIVWEDFTTDMSMKTKRNGQKTHCEKHHHSVCKERSYFCDIFRVFHNKSVINSIHPNWTIAVVGSSLKNLHNVSTTLNCKKIDVERHQKYILNWCVKEHMNTRGIQSARFRAIFIPISRSVFTLIFHTCHAAD